MPPKLVSDDGRHIVIRPLAYCREKDLEAYARLRQFPIIPCNLCGSQENLQRQVVKDMLKDWEKRFPGRLQTMFASLQRVVPSHLLDPRRFDFAGLKTQEDAYLDGDIGLDEEEFSATLIQLPVSRAAESK
jgi:tRNA 2-thiocytidine biosynthesis protein TtcA